MVLEILPRHTSDDQIRRYCRLAQDWLVEEMSEQAHREQVLMELAEVVLAKPTFPLLASVLLTDF